MATARQFSTVINGVMVDDLFSTIDAVKATPAIAKFKFGVRNRWATGSQNATTAEGFHGAMQDLSHSKPFVLEADEPAEEQPFDLLELAAQLEAKRAAWHHPAGCRRPMPWPT